MNKQSGSLVSVIISKPETITIDEFDPSTGEAYSIRLPLDKAVYISRAALAVLRMKSALIITEQTDQTLAE